MQLAYYRSGDTFGPRQLSDYEFVWVLRGSALWTVTDPAPAGGVAIERRTLLTPGMLALGRSGAVDSYAWDPARSSTHAYVHLSIPDPGHLPVKCDWPVTRSLVASPILAAICDYLLELAGQQSPAARRRSDELVALLLDLFVTGPLEQPEQGLPSHVVEIVDTVRRAWSVDGLRAVEVAELARAAHLSVGHVFRLFREHYGCGPARTFELVRLSRAAVSLQRSNATIAEIADVTGFANPYHFSRRFALTYGLPPGAYRTVAPSPDPLEPVRRHHLLPVAHAVQAGE